MGGIGNESAEKPRLFWPFTIALLVLLAAIQVLSIRYESVPIPKPNSC